MSHSRFLASSVLLAALFALLATPVGAQKLGRKYFEDDFNGFRFKPIDDFLIVPPKPEEEALGVICKMSGDDIVLYVDGMGSVKVNPSLVVLRFPALRMPRSRSSPTAAPEPSAR